MTVYRPFKSPDFDQNDKIKGKKKIKYQKSLAVMKLTGEDNM